MVVIRQIVRNGNSAQVTIPTEFLRRAGMKLGEKVAIELVEDGTIWVRRPAVRDLRAGSNQPMESAPVLQGFK